MAKSKNNEPKNNSLEAEMADFKVLFGRRVKHYRDLKNFTQEYLSALINVEQVTLSNIETGKSHPSFETMYRLARALDVKPYQLYTIEPYLTPQDMAKEISNAMYFDKNLAELIYKFFCTVR